LEEGGGRGPRGFRTITRGEDKKKGKTRSIFDPSHPMGCTAERGGDDRLTKFRSRSTAFPC